MMCLVLDVVVYCIYLIPCIIVTFIVLCILTFDLIVENVGHASRAECSNLVN